MSQTWFQPSGIAGQFISKGGGQSVPSSLSFIPPHCRGAACRARFWFMPAPKTTNRNRRRPFTNAFDVTPLYERGARRNLIHTRRTSINPHPKPLAGPIPSNNALVNNSVSVTSISPSKSTELNPASLSFCGRARH